VVEIIELLRIVIDLERREKKMRDMRKRERREREKERQPYYREWEISRKGGLMKNKWWWTW